MGFPETVATCELKVCTCRQPNDCVKLVEYQRSRSDFNNKTVSFLRNYGDI